MRYNKTLSKKSTHDLLTKGRTTTTACGYDSSGGKRLIEPTFSDPSRITHKKDKKESLLKFIYNPNFWLQTILVLILISICQRFKFFNYRTTYYLYGIVLLFIVNIINEEAKEENSGSNSPSQTNKLTKASENRDKKYKNEPYKINYTNPFITNLDNINFNFRAQYNLGDFKTYLFNKIDELLISKYISFYKVLSFNKNNLGNPLIIKKEFDINDNYTNIFLGLSTFPTIPQQDGVDMNHYKVTKKSNEKGAGKQIDNNDIYLQTKALVLMRGNVLKIPALGVDANLKPVPTTSELNDRELYIQIYERNDLNKYKSQDNLTIIKDNLNMTDRCTLIDTNLDARVQYVAHISYMNTNKNPVKQENILDILKDYEKKTHDAASESYKAFKPDNTNGLLKQFYADNSSITEVADTSAIDLKEYITKLRALYNKINSTGGYIIENDRLALLAKIRRVEYERYSETITVGEVGNSASTSGAEPEPYFPDIETDKYYPLDHAMFVKGNRRYIADSYPYLLIPVILIDKPNININKPLFYENTKDIQKNRQQRNWLMKEYNKIIEKQFKGHIFSITSYYRKYAGEKKDLIYDGLSDAITTKVKVGDDDSANTYTTLNDKLFIVNYSVAVKQSTYTVDSYGNIDLNSTGKDFYKRLKNNQNDIAYNTHNKLNKSKNMVNEWGFVISIENILPAIDEYSKELNRDTMPYLVIQYGKIEKDGTSGKLGLNTATSCFTVINLSITTEKTLFYDKNKELPFLYNKISDKSFNTTNEITLDKEAYIDELNKIKDDLLLSEKPDKFILKDIDTKLKQYNSPYSNNKIFISENFVNTEFLYDYKIKMNMIVKKILDHYFRANLLSIQEWSFNFSKTKLVKFDNLLRYGNKKKLILRNIPITRNNINKHFKDIYDLRIQYRHFLINIYKNLWFLTESSSKPENYYSEYFIESNNKYYYFDSSRARNYDLNFHKNIENIINKTPVISIEKTVGVIKYFIKHIGIEQNLVNEATSDVLFTSAGVDTIQTGTNITYRPTYKIDGSLEKGDLFLIHSNDNYQVQIEPRASKTRKTLIKNYNKDNSEKYIKKEKGKILININQNVTIQRRGTSAAAVADKAEKEAVARYLAAKKAEADKKAADAAAKKKAEADKKAADAAAKKKAEADALIKEAADGQNGGYRGGAAEMDPVIDIETVTMPELFGRNFIYVSEDSLKTNSDDYIYPNFIKIGKNIESINIGTTEDGYSLPNIRLIETERGCSNIINNDINNETNIFPIINAYSLHTTLEHTTLDDAPNRTGSETFSKNKLMLLELPSNIDWAESRNNEKEIIFNSLDDKIKNKHYKIFDYSHNFTYSNLLNENLVIKEIIFNSTTPTRFKIKINDSSKITTDPLLILLFKAIQNAKIYEKYVTFHNINYIGNDITYDSKINYLLPDVANCLIKQNSMYKIYNICKNTVISDTLNDYIIEFETYYNVCTENAVYDATTNEYKISNIQNNYTLGIKKYTNIDKRISIISKDVDNYNINENICQYIDNINECFEYYKLESIKSENNINKDIWNMNSFYYGRNLIDFRINDIVNANTDSKKNTFMTRLIDNIIFNEVSKVHYNIPKKIGIRENSKAAVDTYNYGGDLFIPYYKRNQPVSTININTDENICIDYGTIVNANVVTINKLAIYNTSIGTYKQYYYYYKNIFINILGLYDDINAECNNFIKLGKSILNKEKTLNQSTKLTSLKKYIKIPLNLNRYLTFSDNYMLFIRKTKKILDDNNTSLTKEMLGLPVMVNNRYFDSTYLSKFSSNTENTKKCKRFLQKFIKQFKIGMSGFTSDIAEEICSRIYTVYDRSCGTSDYVDTSQDSKFNIISYNTNKKRDKCFNTIFNDLEHTEKQRLIENNKYIFKENCEDQLEANFGSKTKTEAEKIAKDNKVELSDYYDTNMCYTKGEDSDGVGKYLDEVNLSQHRIATVKDIERYMNDGKKNSTIKTGMSVDGFGLVKEEPLPNISNLVKPNVMESTINNEKVKQYHLEYINKADIDRYNNKGLFCYGRKPDNSKLSKEGDAAIFYFNQKKIKQNIRDIKKYENIEYFNVPEENYSAWN